MAKKKYLTWLLAATLLTACGGGAASSVPEASKAESLAESSSAAESAESKPESAQESAPESANESVPESVAESVPEPLPTEPSWEIPMLESIAIEVGQKYRYDADYGEDYKLYAEVEWGEVRLSNSDSERYPVLAETLYAVSEESRTRGLAAFEDISASAREMAAQAGGAPTFSDISRFYVRRSDSAVVSLLRYAYGYSGGAHGYDVYEGINLDSATGTRIHLADIVADEEGFISLVADEVARRYPDNQLSDVKAYMAGFPEDAVEFTIESNGVTLYFNTYSLGSYAEGPQIVAIPFAGNENLFNAHYAGALSWMVEAAPATPTYSDVDADGVLEELSVYSEWDEYGTAKKVIFYLDGEEFGADESEDATGFYSMNPVYVHMADGRDYAYLIVSMDGDYHETLVYSLDGAKAELVGSYPGGFRQPSDYEEGALRCALVDVEDFELEVHSDILSTHTAYSSYRVGAEGVPESNWPWYYINWPNKLTLKQDLTLDLVSERTGEILGSTTVAAGTELEFVRTDAASYVHFRLPDGSLVQVNVEPGDWPGRVQGILADELFDGMIFAG